MKKYVLLVLLSLLLISNKTSAQASLGISQTAYVIYNDTVSAFTSDSISIYMVNKGDSTFTDNFFIITEVQDSNQVIAYHAVDTLASLFASTILPGDSIQLTLSPFYSMGDSSTFHHYDINVIVIWPLAATSTATTKDSLFYNIFILLPTSINEIDLSHLINAYPNPAVSNITLENTGKNSIEEVRIYDPQGRLIEHLTKPEYICTEAWAPGMYLINIQLEDGKTHTIRVVKQ